MAARLTGSGEETRRKLLQVAADLFAQKGYAEATVRELARQAGCNVACIGYHFGSKDKLYEAVMVSLFRELASQRVTSLQKLLANANGAPSLQHVLTTFSYAFLRPFLAESGGETKIRLLVREMVNPVLPREILENELLRPVQEALKNTLKASVPELSDQQVPLVIYSFWAQLVQIVHLHLFAPTMAKALSTSPDTFVEHVVAFTEGGIRALNQLSSKKAGPV